MNFLNSQKKTKESPLLPDSESNLFKGLSRKNGLFKVKGILLIFTIDTFILIVASAGLSLIFLLTRVFFAQQTGFTRIMSISVAITVVASYAFYLVFDLCEHLFSNEKDYENET